MNVLVFIMIRILFLFFYVSGSKLDLVGFTVHIKRTIKKTKKNNEKQEFLLKISF